MKRRGFLGALLGLPAAAKALAEAPIIAPVAPVAPIAEPIITQDFDIDSNWVTCHITISYDATFGGASLVTHMRRQIENK